MNWKQAEFMQFGAGAHIYYKDAFQIVVHAQANRACEYEQNNKSIGDLDGL
jgi:hypothetical protein